MNFPFPLNRVSVRIAAGVYAVASLVCTQVPLLNYLGYEASFVLALLGSGIAGVLTIRMVREHTAECDVESVEITHLALRGFRAAVAANVFLLLIPLVILLLNGLFVKNCSVLQGLGFFVLLPAVSVWFSCCLGFFCTMHYRFASLAFTLIGAATIVYSLMLGYVTPAIYSYNVFYGYFPGLSYDELISMDWSLVLFRIVTIMLGLMCAWCGWLIAVYTRADDPFWRKGLKLLEVLVEPPRVYRTAIVVVVLGLLYVERCDLGFESSAGHIRRVLGARLDTEHFTVYYSAASIADEEIRWIAAEHEFRLREVMNLFLLPHESRIESYVYPSAEVKRRLTGTGTTNIAKPWNREIHLTQQSLDGSLQHEIVHVLAGRFGLPVLRASMSTGLVEGLAMAIEGEFGNRSLHQCAAALRRTSRAPDVKDLMGLPGFAAQSSSVSYVMAGSFCRYLIDRHGMRKFTQVYRSVDYNAVYGRALSNLVDEWNGFLDRIPEHHGDRDLVDVFFRRPAVFGKVCARVVAARNDEASKSFSRRDYLSAQRLYEESFDEAGGYESFGGYLVSSVRRGEYALVDSLYASVIMSDARPAQYLPLFVSIGDALWGMGYPERSVELYRRVQRADFSPTHTEGAIIRSIAVGDSTLRVPLREYFLADAVDSVRLARLDSMSVSIRNHRLTRYLRGRLLRQLKRYKESAEVLGSIRLDGLDKDLEAFRLRELGTALFRQGLFQEAKSVFWTSLNYRGDDVALNRVHTWIDRCDWMAAHPLP